MFKELQGFVDRNKENPFFIYWANNQLPHAAFKLLKKWVDYYK